MQKTLSNNRRLALALGLAASATLTGCENTKAAQLVVYGDPTLPEVYKPNMEVLNAPEPTTISSITPQLSAKEVQEASRLGANEALEEKFTQVGILSAALAALLALDKVLGAQIAKRFPNIARVGLPAYIKGAVAHRLGRKNRMPRVVRQGNMPTPSKSSRPMRETPSHLG